jgi:hypothetical protein
LDDVLGILLLAGYIVGILGLSALVTFAVVKIFPTERNPKKPDKPDKPQEQPSGNGGEGAGRLFRRAKRGTA